MSRILIAEDERSMQELLSTILREAGHDVTVVGDGLSAIARLGGAEGERFDVVLTDLRMPGADGLSVLAAAQKKCPGVPVIMITAFGSISGAVDAMRLGAFDYLSKPLPSPQALRSSVERALTRTAKADAAAGARQRDVAETAPSADDNRPRRSHANIISVDQVMAQVVRTVEKVAERDTTVLLLGESGVGKEVIAKLIHESSERAKGPFVAVNCAALTESLLESELFGHEKGAFTGADMRREGRFVQADGGTLFLDEIGETSPGLQAKLLRALQERTFERVGGTESIKVDARFIAATNRDLEKAVEEGSFRQDLYYRLAVFPISIPPLRARPGDILPLAEHFVAKLSKQDYSPATLSDDAKQALLAHDWPGNVRELQNVIERAMVLAADEGVIEPDMLGIGVVGSPVRGGTGEGAVEAGAGAAIAGGGTLKDMEKRAIAAALAAEGGNRRKAAKRLGIALRTLQYKIKSYGLK
ncbi:MAG: sigma-54-dependent Fis family transcriptional regulator [Myxococcales bacterium]|nr:sigma-54-dependent Fis family transcriptional regulator [Myxococcales bacterium]